MPPAENPNRMRKPPRERRRPNLATLVGSGLAVVAAGSLLAFSSLAEQAGLEGLATNGLQPAQPGRVAGKSHAITIPAPATEPPRDPRDALADLVRDSIARADVVAAPEPGPAFTPGPTPRRERPQPNRRPGRPDHIANRARVAFAGPDSHGEEADAAEWDGPPYGHAYGHYKKDHARPKKAKKHEPRPNSGEQPVYARTASDEHPKAPKPPKMKKAEKGPGKAKAKGHAKHAHERGNGKGKGHSKHGG